MGSNIIAQVLHLSSPIFPRVGIIDGGFEITIKGNNFDAVDEIYFGSKTINDFQIIDNQTIIFQAPVSSTGPTDLRIIDTNGEESILDGAFIYFSPYPEGSLIRAKNGHKVYVVKGRYKRWIQTAEIFNGYGHLKWENIIEVKPEELEFYQDAWLIRADGDKKVYQVSADGIKRWLNITGQQFSESGRDWASVYIVNSFERDAYTIGEDVIFESL